jgi:hypothetical protein
VNGQSLNLGARTAILDTGTTLLVLPRGDVDALHGQISGSASDGQGGYTIPCDTTAAVAFSFGGTSFKINAKDLIFNQIGGNSCTSGITAGSFGGATQMLLGDVFLKRCDISPLFVDFVSEADVPFAQCLLLHQRR